MGSQKLSKSVYGALLVVVCCWLGSHLYPPINLDVGCLLYVAKRWLLGDRLYVDVIDPNTPWAIALHVPAEFTAARLGLDGPTWFSVYVTAAIVVSVGLVWLLARSHEAVLGGLTARILPLATLFAIGVDPGRCFGQREHLLMVAALPYLVLCALRARSVEVPRFQSALIALIAGLGFAIKPHFALPLLLVELYLMRGRGLRVTLRDPVPWLIGAVLVTHVVFALVGTPEYLAVVVPFAAEAYTTPVQMLSSMGKILLGLELAPVSLLLPLLGAIAFWTSDRAQLARVLTVFAAAAAVVSALQGKGWDYHSVPALDATLLLAIITLTGLIERHALAHAQLTEDASRLLAACVLIPFLFLDGLRLSPLRDQITFSESAVHDWLEVMTKNPGNQRALVLSAGMYPQYPAMNYADFRMTMPFMSLWALRGVYAQCDSEAASFRPVEVQSEPEQFVYQKVIEGFIEQKPQVVAVDRDDAVYDCQKKNFDYLKYFSRDVRFAREFRNYRPLTKVGVFDFYERMAGAVARPSNWSGRR